MGLGAGAQGFGGLTGLGCSGSWPPCPTPAKKRSGGTI